MGKYATASTLPLTMRCQKVVLRKLEANQTLAASCNMKQASEIPCEKMCSVLGHVLANLLLVHLWKDNVDSSGFALLPSTTGSLELLGRDSYRISYVVEVQSLHLGTLSSRFHPSFIHKKLAACCQGLWPVETGLPGMPKAAGSGRLLPPCRIFYNSTLGVDGKR